LIKPDSDLDNIKRGDGVRRHHHAQVPQKREKGDGKARYRVDEMVREQNRPQNPRAEEKDFRKTQYRHFSGRQRRQVGAWVLNPGKSI